MTPLLVSGIASIASSAIDAWTNAANRRVAVEQAKFENAIHRAMGVSHGLTPAPGSAQALEQQIRNAPEVRAVLDAQPAAAGASLQVSADGRIFVTVPGNAPSELTVSLETQALARQLNVARAAVAPAAFSSALPMTGTFVPGAR